MFNNRQSRRRFRLGNLARLVQLRQSVSHQPPPPPSTLPSSFSETDENRDSPQHVSTGTKSSPPSPSSTKSMEEIQPQPTPPPMSKPVETDRNQLVRSSPRETGESQPQSPTFVPPSPLTSEAKPPPSPPSTLNFTEESQSQPSLPLPTSEFIDETRLRSPSPSQKSPPSLSESGESQPPLPPPQANKTPPSSPLRSLSEYGGSQLPKPLPEAEIPTFPPTTVNATEDSQPHPSPPVPPFKSINETKFPSPPPSPPSLSEYVESQPHLPPTQANKTLPSSPSKLNAKEESQRQQSPPLLPSKSIDETRVPSSAPSLPESSESKPHVSPKAAKIQSSTLNPDEEYQRQPPPPSKTIDETRFRSSPPLGASPPALPESGESQPPLPPPAAKMSLQSTLNHDEESQSQPPPLSKTIDETRLRSSPPLDASPQSSLSESGDSPPLPPPAAKFPTSQQSTLNSDEESKSQPPPPSKTIDETRFRSSPPLDASPPSLPESGDSQPPVPQPKAQIPMSLQSTLNPNEESKSQPPPPSKIIDETRFNHPIASMSESGESVPPSPPTKAKVPLSTLNSAEESEPQQLPPSKSIDETLSQSSKSIEEPKPTLLLSKSRSQANSLPPQSKLLSPKASENLQSQSHIPSPTTITAPPPLSSPPKSHHVIPPPKPSLSNPIQSPSPKLKNTEPHNQGENHNPEKSDGKLVKIPAEKTEINREKKAIWSEERNPMPMMMMMFINSNVQGINTSLSLDSSSIDHHPGVHLTIDYDQNL